MRTLLSVLVNEDWEHIWHMRPPRGRGYAYQLFAGWGWTSILWLGALRQPTLVMHGTPMTRSCR